MSVPNEIRNLTEGVVTSFESEIAAVELLINKGLDVLDGYRQEEEAIRGNLRESFASIGSLRRKDFDDVMERILAFQTEREAEIKKLIRGCLARQKDLAGRLKRSLAEGILEEADRCKKELSEIIEKAKEEVVAFQVEQERIRKTLTQLEMNKEKVSAREFKQVIQDLEQELSGGQPENGFQRLVAGQML